MEDNDKKLEQFFHKKFANNIAQEAWNTPDDDIWIGIESDIIRRKKHKKRFGLLLPLIFSAIGVGAACYFYCQNRSNESKIKELQIKLEACGANSGNAVSANKQKKVNDQISPQKLTGFVEKKMGGSMTNNPDLIQLSAYQIDSSKHAFRDEVHAENIVGDNKKLHVVQKADLFSGSKTAKRPIPVFDQSSNNRMLPFMQLLSPSIKLARYFKIDQKEPVNKKRRLFQISGATVALFWKDRLHGKLDQPLSELLKKETVSNTLAYGVLMKKGFSRHWSFDAGLLVGNRTNTSTYLLSVPYTLHTEHNNPDGTIDNEFHHSLPTGLGNVNTVLVLNRSANSNVTDQEKINLDFAFQQKTQSVFLPLKLTVYTKSVGQGFFGAFGVNAGFDLKNQLSVSTANSLHSTVHEKSISIKLGNKKQRPFNFQGTIDFGYQLPITSKLSATLNMGYNHALINKYKTPGFGHKLDNFGIGLSINQRF